MRVSTGQLDAGSCSELFEIPAKRNVNPRLLLTPLKLPCTALISGPDETAVVYPFRSASVVQSLANVLRNFLEFDDDWVIP